MLNREVRILCKYENNLKVQKVIDKYSIYGRVVSMQDDAVMLVFVCSIFSLKKLKHDIELLNNIGIETKMM